MDNSNIAISAGLVIIQDNKILLGHPTGAKWTNTYSIPKGIVQDGENLFDAAFRETREEFGVDNINLGDLLSTMPGEIDYVRDNLIYKKVFYYVIVTSPFRPIIIDQTKLQKEEMDWAGFLTKAEAQSKIFWRQKEVLKFLK